MKFRSQIVAREFKWRSTRSVCGDSSIHNVEHENLYRNESHAKMLTHAHRRVTCALSRRESKICAGTSACGGMGVDVGKSWTVEDTYERHTGRNRQLGA